MGNGPRQQPDEAKPRPFAAARDLNDAVIGLGLGDVDRSAQEPIDYCLIPQVLEASFYRQAVPGVGESVWLELGEVPYIVGMDRRQLGIVSDRQASGIRRCIEDGYRMRGVVLDLSDTLTSGHIRVSGSPL